MWCCEAAKTVAVLTGPPGHHVQSAGDMSSVTRHVTSVFSSHLTSGAPSLNTQPVRFTASHNAVLLGAAYGLATAHSAPTGLPATLHPILQAVDTRQITDRLVAFHTASSHHTRTRHFNSHFLGKRGLASCLLDSQSPVILILASSQSDQNSYV